MDKIFGIIVIVVGIFVYKYNFSEKAVLRDNLKEGCMQQIITKTGLEFSKKFCGCIAETIFNSDMSVTEFRAMKEGFFNPIDFINEKEKQKCLKEAEK